MSEYYPVDSSDLRARGTKGVMSAIGGVALLGVSVLVSNPIGAGIVGGALALLGLSGVFSRNKSNRGTGGIVLIVGGIALASAFLHGPLGGLLWIGGLALLAVGGWNIFKFVKGLKSRA
jgi:hypothetical protein